MVKKFWDLILKGWYHIYMTTKFQLTKIRWIGDTLVQRPKKCTFFLIKSKKPICVLFSVAQTSGLTNSDREVPNFPPGGKVTWLRIRQWILRPSTLDKRRHGSKVSTFRGHPRPLRCHPAQWRVKVPFEFRLYFFVHNSQKSPYSA